VKVDFLERELVAERKREHDHSSDPKEENIVAGFQKLAGEETRKFRILIWPAKSGEREKRGGEPSVKDIGILLERDLVLAALELFNSSSEGFFFRDSTDPVVFLLVERLVLAGKCRLVSRDAMSPPELSRDAPRSRVFEPPEPRFLVTFWDDLQFFICHNVARSLGHHLSINVPLWLEQRLDDVLRSGTHWHDHGVVFSSDVLAHLLQVFNDLLSDVESLHAVVFRSRADDEPVVVEDVDLSEAVSLAHIVVIIVVRGRDLEGV
jgi:hypothetical protein